MTRAWWILLRKEALESWRTMRLPVVVGLFLVVGFGSPLLARFLPEIIEAAGGDLGGITLPPPVAADALAQLWKNLAQFGAFTAIILAMGAVAAERDRGTAAFVLSNGASRGAFLGAKVVVIGAVLAIGVALATAVAWIYTAILFEPPSILGWLAVAALAWLSLAAWGSITFLGSTVTGSTAAAAGIGFGAWLGLTILGAIPTVTSLLPAGLTGPALALGMGIGASLEPSDVLTPVLATVALIGASVFIAARSFGRQEL